jgi:transcriptional regulator NrdR family protein
MAAWTGIKKGGQQMICPYCQNIYLQKKVLGTWTVKNGSVKRQRKCRNCGKKFNTVELVVVREKLLYGLKPINEEQG